MPSAEEALLPLAEERLRVPGKTFLRIFLTEGLRIFLAERFSQRGKFSIGQRCPWATDWHRECPAANLRLLDSSLLFTGFNQASNLLFSLVTIFLPDGFLPDGKFFLLFLLWWEVRFVQSSYPPFDCFLFLSASCLLLTL